MAITPGSLWYYVVVVLIGANLFALLIGVLMLAVPRRLQAWSRLPNRWISTRKLTKPLDQPRPTDHLLLRYPAVLGAVLLASAALILIKGAIFVTNLSVADGGQLLARLYPDAGLGRDVWEVLWLSLIGFITLGALLAFWVGAMAWFRQKQLARWVRTVNRWISTRMASKALETQRYQLDRWVSANPRLWGGVITATALFSSVMLWAFVL